MFKRTIATLLITLSLVTLAQGNVLAVEHLEAQVDAQISSPRFTHVSVIVAGLSIDEFGYATPYGIVQLSKEGFSTTLTCELQRFKDGKWSTLKTWTPSGDTAFGTGIEGGYYVSSGYIYRSHVTAIVKDSSGKTVETVTCNKEARF